MFGFSHPFTHFTVKTLKGLFKRSSTLTINIHRKHIPGFYSAGEASYVKPVVREGWVGGSSTIKTRSYKLKTPWLYSKPMQVSRVGTCVKIAEYKLKIYKYLLNIKLMSMIQFVYYIITVLSKSFFPSYIHLNTIHLKSSWSPASFHWLFNCLLVRRTYRYKKRANWKIITL